MGGLGLSGNRERRYKRNLREAVNLAAFNSISLDLLISEATAIARRQYMPAFPRWLSREDFACRKDHAGPELETPGAQCIGTYRFEYSLIPFGSDLNSAVLIA